MRICNGRILILAISMATSAAMAQEHPPSQYERLKRLEPFIGYWQGDFKSDDADGTVTMAGRWIANRSFVHFSWSFQPAGGARMHMSTVIVGWDGREQRLSAWGFSPHGYGDGEASLKDGTLTLSMRGPTPEGEEIVEGQGTYKVAEDELTVTIGEHKRGGETVPGYTMSLRRREHPAGGER